MGNYLEGTFWGVRDKKSFLNGIDQTLKAIEVVDGVYLGDNLLTYGRNLSFLDDEPLMKAFNTHAKTHSERAILWRLSTVLWGVRKGLSIEGDFVECACYKGTAAPDNLRCSRVFLEDRANVLPLRSISS